MEKVVLSKEEKQLMRQVQLRSHLVFLDGNMVNMLGNGFTYTLIPVIESLYKEDPEGKKAAYARCQQYFNTNAVPFSFIAGLTWAMEKEHKEKQTVDGKTIESVKTALMGPTAGMFDALFFNCIRVIAGSIGVGLCAQGNVLGVLLFILIFGVPQSILKFKFVEWGYVYGTSFIDRIFRSGLMKSFTKAASILGIIMVGALTAQMVNVPLNIVMEMGETMLDINAVINSIFPGLLGVALLFWLARLIKKGVRPTKLVIGIIVLGLAGALIGVF